MIIKKFQGKTESEATEAAKKELGSAVVIMNVKDVKRKGIFSFLKPKMVEVTVALEEEPERVAPVQRKAGSPRKPESSISAVAASSDEKKQDDAAIEEKLENLQSLLEKQFQREEQVKEPEVKEEKSDKTETVKEEPAESNSNVRFFKLLYNTMMENEIDEKYANQIIDELDRSMKPNMPIDFMLSIVYQKLILKFGKPGGITPAEKGPKVIFFIGPTGVGKTTTIAKIASRFCVEGKKKVALLTADTYRIAAAEQLRTYANILEVPFRVIYSTEEIRQAVAEFSSFDYIFVDTAGHSHHNEKQRESMNDFIQALDESVEKEVYLVISATTKYKDLLSIADTYSAMTRYNLIFTKLDETTTLGNLLNLKLHTGEKMSYITCGQNVPDDMEDFNPQKTVKLLLGGNHIS